ncbi:MAG: hypothetical protein ABGZ35_04555, partial [Planctomycetaceae bacterium]
TTDCLRRIPNRRLIIHKTKKRYSNRASDQPTTGLSVPAKKTRELAVGGSELAQAMLRQPKLHSGNPEFGDQ